LLFLTWLIRLRYYGLALLFVGGAALLRWALSDALRPAPSLVFYLAWVGAAAFGGLGPGLLATVASWLCLEVLFDFAPGHVGFNDPGSIARLLVFLAGGLVVSAVGEKMRRTRLRERRQGRELAAANAALTESRKRYRGLVERINDWAWEVDAACVYTYASPRALELLGYPPEEIVGKTPFDFMPPAEAQRVRSAFQPLWLERKPLELLENTLVRKDGSLVTVETSGMPLVAEDGSFLGYTGIDRDVTARKWAEEQLRRSEQDLNRAQAVAQTGSWRLNVRRNELLWSKETYRIFGIPDGTLMTYETFLAAVHPADREYVDRQWTAALRGEPYDIEHRIVVDGRLKWVREKAELEFDKVAKLLGGFGTVQDITERKRAEEALRASQSMLQSVMDNVPQGVFWKDRHSTYLGCNKVFAQAAGLESAGDIIGKTDYDLPWSPEQTAAFREYDRRIMENDVPEYHIIEQQREGNGKLAWLETNKVPLHDAQGNVIGILGTYEDITERKRAEEALQASEAKYRFLVENSKDITWMIDLQGRWTFISSNVEKVAGYRPDDVVGKTIWDFLAPECHAPVRERLDRRRHGEDVPPYEVLVVGKDGRHTPFELHTAPILDGSGRIVGVQGVSRDITERKRAQEALREWNATLESRVARRTKELEYRARQLQKLTLELTETEERERKRLAEILHDDLQQMLAAAKFQVSLLGRRVTNDPDVQEIAEQANALLVGAIAKSRSLSHELSVPALSRSDLGEAFEWLAEQMQKKHGFTVHLQMCGRIEVASEPLRILLYKAAQELLFNVIKHAGVHEASLRLRRQRGRIRLSVSDRGRGFDPAEPGASAGFGLLSIRERVGCLGGRLKICSARGKGSTFLISLPDTSAREDP
jgi:PAS domain S-box-containing protein